MILYSIVFEERVASCADEEKRSFRQFGWSSCVLVCLYLKNDIDGSEGDEEEEEEDDDDN